MNKDLRSDIESKEEYKKRLSILLDTMRCGVQINDCEGTITYSNKAHHMILGYQDGELTGKKIWHAVSSAKERNSLKDFFATLVNKRPPPVPYFIKNKNISGELVDLQIDWNYEYDTTGSLQGFISIITDITASKKSEKELLHRTQGLYTLLEISKNIGSTLDLQKVLQRAVDGMTELAGLDTAAVYLLDRDTLLLQATTPPLPSHFPEELKATPLKDHPHILSAINSGEPVLVKDVKTVELSRAEKAVTEQRNLRTVFYVPVIVDANAIGVFILGSIRKPVSFSGTEADLSATLANLIALTIRNSQLYLREQEHAAQLEQNLAERKQAEKEKSILEQQLRQAYKMEAIGTMAGGIAHDFNNILSIFINANEMALAETPRESKAFKYNKIALKAAHRAKDLVKQILAFSRQSEKELIPVNLSLTVQEDIKLIRSTIPTTVEIIQDVDTRKRFIKADPTELHQLLLNLCTNAVDAMDEKGILEIRLKEVSLHRSDLGHRQVLKPGQYLQLSVSDSGCGITKENLDHIFDPFFTTKGVGEGTGMGLAVIHGIVDNHNGLIKVESELGRGTTFDIFFPLIDTDTKIKTEETAYFPRGNEHILLVDDEEMLAEMWGSILERLGYKVTISTVSTKALEIFKSTPDAFDLIITDQTMPDMTGMELGVELLKLRPDIPIILCTGYSRKVSEEDARKIGIKEMLLKPFDRRLLSTRIRKVLDVTKIS